MVNKQQIQQPLPTTSKLQQFTLGFEFDKTIQEVKRDVRIRTYKDA